jgi:hypothetical protein
MTNLEDFLRQAAERRKQRERGGDRPAQQNRPPQMAPPILEAEIVQEPEIIEPEIVGEVASRQLKSFKPKLEQKPRLATDVDQADEKIEEHLSNVFDRQVGSLVKPKKPKGKGKQKAKQEELTATAEPIQPSKTNQLPDDVLAMLRNPKSIRAALITSEIFTRKHF